MPLLLAGLGIALTLQFGTGQAPLIVNRRPATIGPPEEVLAPKPTVLDFEPVKPPAPCILTFEPVEASAPAISNVATPKPDVPSGGVSDDRGEPPFQAIDNLPTFRPIDRSLPITDDGSVATSFARPTFGSVVGLSGPSSSTLEQSELEPASSIAITPPLPWTPIFGHMDGMVHPGTLLPPIKERSAERLVPVDFLPQQQDAVPRPSGLGIDPTQVAPAQSYEAVYQRLRAEALRDSNARLGRGYRVVQPACSTGILVYDTMAWPLRRVILSSRWYSGSANGNSPYFRLIGE